MSQRTVMRFDKIALDGFRAKLEQKRQELVAELSKYGVIISLERCPDDMDAARADMDRAVDVGLSAKAAKEFSLVCATLKKIAYTPSEYGMCENGECQSEDQEILMKRLLAVPWARYCINCQEATDGRRIPRRSGL